LPPELCTSLLSLPPLQRNKSGRRLNPNRCWDLDAQMRQSCHRQRCVTRGFCRDRQNCASDGVFWFGFFCAGLSAQRQARTSIKSAAMVEIKSNAVCLCSRPLFHAPLAGSNQTRQSTSFCKVILLLFHVQSDVGISQEDPFLSETMTL